MVGGADIANLAGADQIVGDVGPLPRSATAWPVVSDLGGSPPDGTFSGTLPAGIGLPGVDFVATFRIQ